MPNNNNNKTHCIEYNKEQERDIFWVDFFQGTYIHATQNINVQTLDEILACDQAARLKATEFVKRGIN